MEREVEKKLYLLLGCVGSGVQHIVENRLLVQIVTVGNRPQPVWTKRVLGVDVDDLPSSVSVLAGQLGGDTQGVRQLCLAGSELTEHLGDGHGLQAPS